jgi:hypothetical protein
MRRSAPIATIPAWTYEGKAPSVLTFFEAIALSDLEGQPIKLTAADQRALLGAVVFGRREIVVRPDGTVQCTIDAGFGRDWDTAEWTADTVRRAAEAGKQLRPGTTGPGYFSYGSE